MKLFLNPAYFRWLDRLPAPRMPRIRKRGQHHAMAGVRFDLAAGKTVKPPRQPGSPWDTAAQPVLTDEETLNLYRRGEEIKRGNWGVIPQREAAEAERLPQVIA